MFRCFSFTVLLVFVPQQLVLLPVLHPTLPHTQLTHIITKAVVGGTVTTTCCQTYPITTLIYTNNLFLCWNVIPGCSLGNVVMGTKHWIILIIHMLKWPLSLTLSPSTHQAKEKEIFRLLKGNLNSVTAADVMEELGNNMVDLLQHCTKSLLNEANLLASFCLLCESLSSRTDLHWNCPPFQQHTLLCPFLLVSWPVLVSVMWCCLKWPATH